MHLIAKRGMGDTPSAGFFPSGAAYNCDASGNCDITQPPTTTVASNGMSGMLMLSLGVLALLLVMKRH